MSEFSKPVQVGSLPRRKAAPQPVWYLPQSDDPHHIEQEIANLARLLLQRGGRVTDEVAAIIWRRAGGQR